MTSEMHERTLELLPAFVLGALDAPEQAAVREHLATCREPHAELDELGPVVPYLALAIDPVEPAPALRARIVDAVAARSPAPDRPGAAPPTERSGRPWWRAWQPLAAIAALAIVVLAGSTAYLAGQLTATHAYADQVARAVQLASVSGSRAVVLAASGSGGTSSALAVLPATGSGVIVAQGLVPTVGAEVYEAWLIQGSGAPVPAGAFTVGADGRGWLGSLAPAPSGRVTVALTREPGPGATRPTLPIVVSGASGAS